MDLRDRLWYALAGACFTLIAVFFVLDLYTPAGIADGIAYVAVVLLSVRLFSVRLTLFLAVLSSLATIGGLVYSPTGEVSRLFAWTNRFLSLSAIWATAMIGLLLINEIARRREARKHLHAANIDLEQRVAEQTWLLTFMRDLAVYVVESDSMDKTLGFILERVGQHHGWLFGQAYLPTSDGRLVLSCGWYPSQPNLFEAWRQQVTISTLVPGQALPGRAFETCEAQWTEQVADDLRLRGMELPPGVAIKSARAIPVCVDDAAIAVLEFFTDQPLNSAVAIAPIVADVMDVSDQLGRLLERRLVESRLHESEERFRLAVEAVEDYAIVQLDADGRVSSWNRGAERITGFRDDEAIGEHMSMFYTAGAVAAGVPQQMLARAATQGRAIAEGWRVRKDGSQFWSSVVLTSLRDEKGELFGFMKITRDMTERKRLETRIVNLTMQEQQRIGRELHDSFGQQVTGIALLAANLKRALETRDAPEAARAASLIEAIEDARTEVRALTKGLLPVEVDAGGLQSALQELAELTETTYELQCEFRSMSPVKVDNNTMATHLFKIAQEAVHNAVKHAQASKLVVSLSQGIDGVTLIVRDNGVGIDQNAEQLDSSGLEIMRYRAGLIDATLDIRRGRRRGTIVTCTIGYGPGPALDSAADPMA
jgi:PAS domain S-box-containing protein